MPESIPETTPRPLGNPDDRGHRNGRGCKGTRGVTGHLPRVGRYVLRESGRYTTSTGPYRLNCSRVRSEYTPS